MLLKDEALKSLGHLKPPLIPCEVWNLIWKVKVPYKVNLFTWRILQDSIPTFLILKNKGIGTNSTCPLCNEDDESTSHIFLHCTFARACWHGYALAVRTSDLGSLSVQTWISNILLNFKQMDQGKMEYLPSIFSLLWTI